MISEQSTTPDQAGLARRVYGSNGDRNWAEGVIARTTTYTNTDHARAAAEWLAESRE